MTKHKEGLEKEKRQLITERKKSKELRERGLRYKMGDRRV